jgi:hypothetical protein
MQEAFFKVDPYIVQDPLPPVWGTNFLPYLIGRLGEAFEERYRRMQVCSEEVLRGTGLRMYPLSALHITIGPPSLFTTGALPLELRATFEEEWHTRIAAWAASPEFPAAFEVEYGEMRLSVAAGFFLVRDASDSVGRIRAKLREIAAEVNATNPQFPALRCPDIVHSTFLRYERAPEVGETEVRARFDRLRESWGSGTVAVPCRELVYIREVRPYLHQDNTGNILGTFPFRGNA